MRKNWTETTLGDAVTVQKGKKPPALVASGESSHPYLTADVLRGATCEQFVPDELLGQCIQLNGRETVLLWDGAGDVFRSQLGVLASTMAKLVARDSHLIDDGYLFLFLNSKQATIKSSRRGTTVPHVSLEALVSLKLPLPPLVEQERIVDLVSSVDSYIAALQRKADAARAARSAVLSELLSAGCDDWIETTIADVAEVLDRFRKPISSAERDKRPGNVPYYGATGQTGWIDEPLFNEELVLLGEDAIDFLNPTAHKAYLIDGPTWVNNHAHVLRARKDVIMSFFLMESLNAVDYSQFITFGTRSKLTQGCMMRITLRVPPMHEQQRIVDIMLSIDDVIRLTEQAVVEAKSLHSGLLSDLLSGDHEIPESYDRLLGAA
jgi:restriction endonuclease S subunit